MSVLQILSNAEKVIFRGYLDVIVSYVWAGIGSTLSIVILFSLFWKKFHGISAVITIVTGLLFTIIWISTGMDKILTSRLLTFLVAGFVAITSTLLIPKK